MFNFATLQTFSLNMFRATLHNEYKTCTLVMDLWIFAEKIYGLQIMTRTKYGNHTFL